jgi:hypothetical protein
MLTCLPKYHILKKSLTIRYCIVSPFLNTFNSRKFDHKIRNTTWIRSILRIPDSEGPEVIVRTFRFRRSAVYQWLNRYGAEGFNGLKHHKIPDKKPVLGKIPVQKIFGIVSLKNPLELKWPFALLARRRD